MRQIHISLQARGDLDAIWMYSAGQWSKTQADEYVLAIHARMRSALDDPKIGVAVALRPDLRKLIVGAHHIYYQQAKDGIRIIRVLHQSMDTRRHL